MADPVEEYIDGQRLDRSGRVLEAIRIHLRTFAEYLRRRNPEAYAALCRPVGQKSHGREIADRAVKLIDAYIGAESADKARDELAKAIDEMVRDLTMPARGLGVRDTPEK